ncbi:hypothetical protein EKK58_06560 [Candidatus Dependentiae bacterium]|nr:MAG: hypothetical protein EKK58_06560 [Candidatus Dependentiae bacterium]
MQSLKILCAVFCFMLSNINGTEQQVSSTDYSLHSFPTDITQYILQYVYNDATLAISLLKIITTHKTWKNKSLKPSEEEIEYRKNLLKKAKNVLHFFATCKTYYNYGLNNESLNPNTIPHNAIYSEIKNPIFIEPILYFYITKRKYWCFALSSLTQTKDITFQDNTSICSVPIQYSLSLFLIKNTINQNKTQFVFAFSYENGNNLNDNIKKAIYDQFSNDLNYKKENIKDLLRYIKVFFNNPSNDIDNFVEACKTIQYSTFEEIKHESSKERLKDENLLLGNISQFYVGIDQKTIPTILWQS